MVLKYPEGKQIPLKAGADITAGQVVELTGDETVGPTEGASSKVIGVALVDAKAGEKVTVVTEGVVEVIAAGAISAGTKVVSAIGGKVAAYTPYDVPATFADTDVEKAVAEATKIIGIALTSASADGDKILVKLTL